MQTAFETGYFPENKGQLSIGAAVFFWAASYCSSVVVVVVVASK